MELLELLFCILFHQRFFFIFLLCGVLVFNNQLSIELVYYVVLKLRNKKG